MVAEKKLVARGVGEEEAERVAKSVGRGGDSEGGREGGGNKWEAVMERDGEEG
jgi:hypothetical protein